MSIRVLLVDDEPLARYRLRSLLQADPDVTIVGECGDGADAVAAVREQRPDLLFLDVQMPELDGFSVLEALGDDRPPVVVFVTAFDRYALRAFEVHALDYLLKPFDHDRFRLALLRAKEQLRRSVPESTPRVDGLLAEVRASRKPAERLVIKSGGRVFFLRTDEIDWIEAAGNYLRLHVRKEIHLLRETMSSIETRLDPDLFLRIHRSTIVNLERVKEMQPWFHGEYVVFLNDGTQLTLSRTHRQKFQERFGKLI